MMFVAISWRIAATGEFYLLVSFYLTLKATSDQKPPSYILITRTSVPVDQSDGSRFLPFESESTSFLLAYHNPTTNPSFYQELRLL
jgi:hypothetical protein